MSNNIFQVLSLPTIYEFQSGRPFKDWTAEMAAKSGNLDIVRLLYKKGIQFTETDADIAAENGHFNVVRFLLKNGIKCTDNGADLAAANGYLHIVRYLAEHGINCTETGADGAAAYGHLDVLEYFQLYGIHCTGEGLVYAIHKNQIEVVSHLMKWFCKTSLVGVGKVIQDTIKTLAEEGDMDFIKPFIDNGHKITGADIAAFTGHLQIIKELKHYGIYCTDAGLMLAVEQGHLHIVQYIYEQIKYEQKYSQLTTFIITAYIANIAASCGHLHIIRYLRTKEIHCDFEGVIWARENGHQEVVQDLYEHGITDVFEAAIAENHRVMMF